MGTLAPPYIREQQAAVYAYIQEQVLSKYDWLDLTAILTAQQQRQQHTLVAAYRAVLPILTCVAVGGEAAAAVPVAAAWVLTALSAQVFDDLQDQDAKKRLWHTWSPQQAISVGLGLTLAAQTCLANMNATPEVCTDIQTTISASCLRAIHSQASAQAQPTLTGYFQDVVAKSGQFVAAFFWAGARCHLETADVLKNVYDLGLSLGILMQLYDDLADLSPLQADNDLRHGKYTLPIIYALSQTKHPLYQQLVNSLDAKPEETVDTQSIYQILVAMKAIAYTHAIAAVYQEKAQTCLQTFTPEYVTHLNAYLSLYDIET